MRKERERDTHTHTKKEKLKEKKREDSRDHETQREKKYRRTTRTIYHGTISAKSSTSIFPKPPTPSYASYVASLVDTC